MNLIARDTLSEGVLESKEEDAPLATDGGHPAAPHPKDQAEEEKEDPACGEEK
ncbi:UNVERIFIED_CONTAM: hypothetical protein Sangu_1863800 [Sesamum angustifolium]|uniref:Uncharacterized protein n=1 Tax=Sesamum angustifolium TaxID=2727405 RepID=A0AAW2LTG9_9LAMI